ncbi:MAG: DUF5009 domain-containing protein [Chitinophagaceae bacterium]
MKTPSSRLLSIDVFRAITMLLMIFVNDVSGVHNIPAWIDHAEAQQDRLGFADTIFPAFLFIVGLSLPLAIENRRNKQHSFARITLYIMSRSLALIVMGFFHVNGENYSSAALLPHAVWTILLTLSFFVIWLDYPRTLSKNKKYPLIGCGIALLILLAILYKGGSPESPEGLQPHWWGILGLIGWAYLVCALIFLLVQGELLLLTIALLILLIINLATHTGWWHVHLPVIGDASSASLVMMGVIASVAYRKLVAQNAYKKVWLFFTTAGILLIAAGLFVRPYAGGISKIYATPAWVFICTGISLLAFTCIAWLVDVQGKYNWFNIIRPAGTSTLTCYLLPYILYSVFALVHFHYPQFMNEGIGGILRSFLVAFVIVIATGWLEKKRIRLKV